MNVPQLSARQALRASTVTWQSEPASGSLSLDATSLAIAPTCSCTGESSANSTCSCGGGGTGGCTCGSPAVAPFIYMIGTIKPAFPSLSVEKEFLQAIEPPIPPVDPLTIPSPQSDAWYFQVLSKTANLYIAREMCWQFRMDAVSPYLVIPRSQNELLGIISASAPTPINVVDFDVVIGRMGPAAPPEMCNGLVVPTIVCDESFDFTNQQYIAAIIEKLKQGSGGVNPINPPVPNPDPKLVAFVFSTVLRMADNTGDTNNFRATNFLAVRYLQVYVLAYNMLTNNFSPKLADPAGYFLNSVSVKPAPVQGNQVIVDVVFAFLGQSTNTLIRWFCRVNVSGEFPFLVLPLTPYYGT